MEPINFSTRGFHAVAKESGLMARCSNYGDDNRLDSLSSTLSAPIIRFNQAEIRAQERRDLWHTIAFALALTLLVGVTIATVLYVEGRI